MIWTGHITEKGYGTISVGKGKDKAVHVYVWERDNGPVPSGMYVDHQCHVRNCANPQHLRLATPGQNMSNRAGASRRSKSGVRNVHPVRDKWGVYISHQGKSRYFGVYETVEEAAEVAKAKREELFGREWAGKS